MTGFGHNAVLGVADKVVEAVKSGAIKHFFLVGGCDGAKTGRNYYTEFVKQTPADTSASWHKKYYHRSVTACVHFSECTELPCGEL